MTNHFGVGAPPILEPILVVGLNRMFTRGTEFGILTAISPLCPFSDLLTVELFVV